jgi:hypothetical protein
VIQGNAASLFFDMNAGGFQNNVPSCYGCFGRDENGAEDLSYDGHYSSNCPMMWDLVNRGCIHKFGKDWCRGQLVVGQPSIPIIFRPN